jgi:hypothetical protein
VIVSRFERCGAPSERIIEPRERMAPCGSDPWWLASGYTLIAEECAETLRTTVSWV